MTTGKSIALTRYTFVGKVMSLLFNMPSRLVVTFLPRSKHLLISWLQSSSAVISICSSPLELIFKVFSDGLPVGMQNQFSSSPPKEKKRRGKQQINIWE